jgi:hypothetical protein
VSSARFSSSKKIPEKGWWGQRNLDGESTLAEIQGLCWAGLQGGQASRGSFHREGRVFSARHGLKNSGKSWGLPSERARYVVQQSPKAGK